MYNIVKRTLTEHYIFNNVLTLNPYTYDSIINNHIWKQLNFQFKIKIICDVHIILNWQYCRFINKIKIIIKIVIKITQY